MKKRVCLIASLLLCGLMIFVISCRTTGTSNEKESSMETVNISVTPENIHTWIAGMKEKLETDTDLFPALIDEGEALIASGPDAPVKAVLHSMVAEMYHSYYQQDPWKINQRTAISGYVPEDIREWSANLFTDTIQKHLDLSLQPAKLLQQTAVSHFREILTTGKDASTLRPTLYDFLSQRAIEIDPTAERYQEWLAFLQSQPDKRAALLVELDYLAFTSRIDSKESYLETLDKLLKVYADKDYSTEIRYSQINALDMYRYRSENPDSILELQYKIAKEGIERYPQYERIGLLKNKLAEMETPTLNSQVSESVYPQSPLSVLLTYKNIKQATIRIYESSLKPIDLVSYNTQAEQKKVKLVKEVSVLLPVQNTYSTQDTTLLIPLESLGLYVCEITIPDTKIQTDHTVAVTQLSAFSRSMTGGRTEVLVTDMKTGKPLPHTTINYYTGQRRDLQLSGNTQTDKNGLAVLDHNKTLAFQATRPGDESSRFITLYSQQDFPENAETSTDLSLFTDRGLYRPGQTVFFKAIAYQLGKEQSRVVTNKTYKVVLRDANNKEVNTKTFTTNTFGSFNGEFVLPKQGLNGHFSLETDAGSTYFRVEEYKRPTFSVEILPMREEIAFGDQVTLHGKAQTFSGVLLQEGNVEWRIIRRPFLWRISGGFQGEEQVAQGNTVVAADGSFSLSFKPEKTENTNRFSAHYNYEVIATITDSKGETQETHYTFPVGETSLVLSTDIPQQLEKGNAKVTISARLLNGEKTKTSGTFTLLSLIADDETKRMPTWKEGKAVMTGRFISEDTLPGNLLTQLPSGRYRIRMEATDSKGREVKGEQDFLLYGKQDKRPPVYSTSWLIKDKTECLPGEDATWTFGTSEKESYILYEVFQNNKRIMQQRFILNNENRSFRLPFKAEYGDGIVATFTYSKQGELYVTEVPVTRKQPDRKLTIRPETFRDRLLPGNAEQWKFRITDNDSLAVSAEVLAGMYDMSLDKILPFQWYFTPERYIYLNVPRFMNHGGARTSYRHGTASLSYVDIPYFIYDQIDWQGALSVGGRNVRMYSRSTGGNGDMMLKAEAAPMYDMVEEELVFDQDISSSEDSGAPQETPDISVQPRTNLQETAFFFPALTTDENGNLFLSFTMPESNTTWKLQAIAHTKELKYGTLTKEVITSKPLMVVPNLPRFLREGDKVTLSAQLLNQSEEAISGQTVLELFDPSTHTPVKGINLPQQTFTIQANGQSSAQWTFDVPAGNELLGVRILADADVSSDGEQHILPVLSNKIQVTESRPFYLIDQKEQQIEVFRQQNGIQPFRLTLEVSGNPVWYAVQALPSLTTPENDNILSWFAAYYGNTLAHSIVSSHPRIRQVISQWAIQGGNASTLLSNLENNEELKNILLEETPWVLEATNETEQKQRLALLFDLNRANNLRETAMQQLQQQQLENGGWGWFKGFYPSRNITLSIMKGMTQLTQLGAVQYNQQEKEMQMRALRYLDESIQKDYESLRKYDKNWEKALPTAEQVEFLYMRSNYRDIPELGDAREAIRFYTDQAEKYWEKLSLYSKGQTALLMFRNGKKEVAEQIMTWLRKTATTSKEQGMYWANNRRGTDYFVSPIDVHCLLMFAFQEITSNPQETDLMKQWLLNQKRTQQWESTPATLNAIHALLLKGSDWLTSTNTVTVKWGEKNYSTAKGEIATGYIKETLTGSAITPQSNRLTIRKEGEAPAWGAVFSQYFAPIDQVSAQKGTLHIEKKLFIEKNDGKQRIIVPAEAGQPLQVGDKAIIRLTIRSEQEMDYVYLKDLRAGCFEPASQLSGYNQQDGIGFYRSPKDISENFFFQHLPKGTFVIEYPVFVSRSGEYAGGISTIQCMYAPEFVSHTEGDKLTVNQ